MESTVQLNVRIDKDLRDAGNAALESKGLSPSTFIRGIWNRLAQRGEALESLCEIVDDSKVSAPAAIDPLEQGQLLYTHLLHDVGLNETTRLSFGSGDDKSRLEEALYEQWHEKGLAHG